MFSASKSTPHRGAGAGAAPSPFVSPSFRQMSLSKRKRDHMDASDVKTISKTPSARLIKRVPAVHCEEWQHAAGMRARLLPAGHILTVKDEVLTVHQNAAATSAMVGADAVADGGSSTVSTVTLRYSNLDLHRGLDVGVGPRGSLDIACCSASGQLSLINVQKGGQLASSDHMIRLTEEAETITAVCHAGTILLLHDVLLLMRYYVGPCSSTIHRKHY
jgi:hypothetical protein